MSKRWGKADFKELKALDERLVRMNQVDFDSFCRKMANTIAADLLSRVKKRTIPGKVPQYLRDNKKSTVTVIGASGKKYKFASRESAIYQQYWSGYTGGTLRDAWTILPIEKIGNEYVITVINPTKYASYVEYGHWQKKRYVPALGRMVKSKWIEGAHIMTVAANEIEDMLPGLLEQKLYKFLYDSLLGG